MFLFSYQKQKLNLESELGSLKAHGGTLETQLDSLKMVPMLLKFHIQITESGKFIIEQSNAKAHSILKHRSQVDVSLYTSLRPMAMHCKRYTPKP